MQHTLIIQCLNYFEYKHLKDNLSDVSIPIDFMDSTYTIGIPKSTTPSFIYNIKCYAPTAKVTQKFTRNGRTTYIKLKD
jgi:hypothetical protein